MRTMRIWCRRCSTNWTLRSIVVVLFSFFALLILGTLYMAETLLSADEMGSSHDDVDELFAEKMKLQMSKRRKVIENVCFREGFGRLPAKDRKSKFRHPPTPNYEAFYFDKKDRLAWCPIYKCASTSWLYNFCLLAGLTDHEIQESKMQLSILARKLYPNLEFEEGQKAMNDSKVKFFMVRHPFQRILSAYRDKLEHMEQGKEHGTMHFYRKYGAKITKKYRKKIPLTGQENNFPNRYQTLERKIEKNLSGEFLTKDILLPDRPEPTFREFVTYLTDVDLLSHGDEHWLPYYVHCTPCFIQYDVIGKFETLFQDQKYLIKMARLENKIQPQWKHLTKGKQTSQLLKKYYSTIPKELLLKLYDKYRLDFEMFEYTPDEYLNYTQ